MTPASSRTAEHRQVLLLEADDGRAALLAAAFRADELTRATSAAAACRLLARGLRPDVIVLDLPPIGATGADLVERLRAAAPGVPIVATASHREDAGAVAMLRAGAADVVAKGPELPARLNAAVDAALARRGRDRGRPHAGDAGPLPRRRTLAWALGLFAVLTALRWALPPAHDGITSLYVLVVLPVAYVAGLAWGLAVSAACLGAYLWWVEAEGVATLTGTATRATAFVLAAVVAARYAARLQRLRALTAEVLASTEDAVVVRDRHGRYELVNEAGERLLGLSADRVLGRTDEELGRPLAEEWRRCDEFVLRTGRPSSVETTVTVCGRERLLSVFRSALRRGGEIAGVVAVCRDVTERVRAERALAASEAQYRTLVDHLPDVIVTVFDRDLRCVLSGGGGLRAAGLSADFLRGQSVADIVKHFPTGEELLAAHRAALAGASRSFDFTSPASRRRYEGDVVPLRDPDGTVTGTMSVLRDVTERVARHQRLRELAEVVSSTEDAVLTLAPDGAVRTVNRAAGDLFGVDPPDLVGRGWAALVRKDAGDAEDPVAAALRERTAQRGEVRGARATGEPFIADVTASPLRGATGELTGVSAIVRDVTAARTAEEALRASERRFDRIASNAPGVMYQFLRSADGGFGLPYVSEGARETLGVDPSRVVEDAGVLFSLVHPDDAESLAASIARSAETLGPWTWRGRAVLPDGTLKWLHGRARPERLPSGDILWDGLLIDETAVRRAEAQRAETQKLLQALLDNFDGVVFAKDHEGRYLFVNAEFERLFGVASDAVEGRADAEVHGPEVAERVRVHDRRVILSGHGVTTEEELPTGGRTRRFLIRRFPLPGTDGEPAGVCGLAMDVTELRELEASVRSAEERFEVAFDRAPIGMVILGPDGRFERVNDAFSQMTGYRPDELAAMSPLSIVHVEDVDAVRERFESLASAHPQVNFEHRMLHADGRVLWVQAMATVIADDRDRPAHVLAQVQDITERRQYEDRLQHMADHDPLTGLLNRRGFERALESQLARVRRYGPRGALLVLDLDGFKYVNDTLGHAAGDELIIGCAAVLSERLRETDIVARLGGDEFAVLVPDEGVAEAETVAAALVEAVREHAADLRARHPGRITASVGVAPFTGAAVSGDAMLMHADLAMYEAKEAGKDRYALYAAEGREQPGIRAQWTWIERIERALEDGLFVLCAQPIVDLRTLRVVEHEVLLRMLDEDGQLVPPATFLHIAERFDLALRVDEWVLTRAIRGMAVARSRGARLPLAVNLSGRSLGAPELVELIGRELCAQEVDPSLLTLEVTETAAVADIPRARRFAEALSDIGCRFALDDFGAGFGSFYYLKHLPFDVLKIDGEFVRRATENHTDRLIIRALTEIARGLGKPTVAEFVPDDATIGLLLGHGVDFGQGFRLGRPVPLDDLLGDHAVPA